VKLSWFISLVLLCVAGASAQTLTGIVVDQTGAAIVDADVTLFDSNRQTANSRTNGEGRFSLSGEITDSSRLVVYASGFSRFERQLKNDGVRDFTIVLQPAPVGSIVTIDAGGTPASVCILSRQRLDETPAQTIDDALRQVPGFTLFRRSSSKTSNPTTQGANLRGVSGSGAARTAVVFDGLSLNDAFGGWTYWSRIPTIAVEQVEVLRGGASSLYGSGGLSGAVNLSSRRREGPRYFRLQTSAGNQKTFDAGVAAGYSHRRWTVDAAGEGFTTAGYIPIDEVERGLVDTRANSRHHNLLAGVERRFGPRGSGNTGRIFLRGNLFSEDRDNGTSLTDNATYFRQASAGADGETFRLGKLQAGAYFQSQVYDQTFSAVSADRNTETLTRIQRVPSDATGGNLFWSRIFRSHTISSSFELRRVRGFSEEIGVTSGSPTSTNRNGGNERTIAFFVQDVFVVDQRLTLSVSARYDGWNNYDASSTTRSLVTNAVSTVTFADRNDNAFSPRVAALFTVNRYAGLFASYSRSFRAPTLNELYRGFRVGNVVTLANEDLRAEIADTFEGGFRMSLPDNRISFRSNVFTIAVTDPIVSVTLSTTPSLITRQRQNIGATRSTGVEMDAEFNTIRNVAFGVGYLYVDAAVTEFPASPEIVGRRLPQVARQHLNLQLRYRPDERWFFGVQSRALSGQFEDDLNTLRLRPYMTVDASSSYRLRKGFEIYGAVENIFNSRYDIGLTPARSVATPFSVRFGVRLDLSE
jgi:outer membrane receptor protein involved in Fe transport